jgi:hypothetical protein
VTFEFSTGPDARPTFMRVNLNILRDMLRLPPEATIVAVRPDPDHPGSCIMDLAGVATPGEVTATYRALHTTVAEFTGWVKA